MIRFANKEIFPKKQRSTELCSLTKNRAVSSGRTAHDRTRKCAPQKVAHSLLMVLELDKLLLFLIYNSS